MHPWEIRYGARPQLGVYTPDPGRITDSLDRWNIEFLWPLDPLVRTLSPQNLLEKYISRVHDRRLDLNYPHCLYMTQAVDLDVSDLYTCMDLENTMYYDVQQRYAVYRRDSKHQIKMIDLEQRSRTGVIFIDCWQNYLDCEWVYSQDTQVKKDFYTRMIDNLWNYNLHSFVFLHGDFDPKPIATALLEWSSGPTAKTIASLREFQTHINKTQIKNWIVVGGHWGLCTHDKPLGFYNLLTLKKQDPSLRFFSLADSTAKFIRNDHNNSILTVCSQDDYKNDQVFWDYKDNLAELILQ